MSIIIKPVVTEKANQLSEKFNRYGFKVKRDANKLEIKKAVEELYNVSVTDVNTMNYLGKSKSRYTKSGVVSGKSPDFKKAVVTVKEGDKIDFYSNI